LYFGLFPGDEESQITEDRLRPRPLRDRREQRVLGDLDHLAEDDVPDVERGRSRSVMPFARGGRRFARRTRRAHRMEITLTIPRQRGAPGVAGAGHGTLARRFFS
jgi:hypothetical protein